MEMTATEKILARHAGREEVQAGEVVWITADVLLTHDVCGPGTVGILKKEFGSDAKVWDKDKVVIIPDHYIFTEDARSRRNVAAIQEFAREQDLTHHYDVGTDNYRGVCHVALPEGGHTRPGEVLIGTDSHTCTAGAFNEFATGVGNTDGALVMGTGRLWVMVPETMKFVVEGTMPSYLMAKDIILHIIGDIGVDGATYRAMEFDGEAVLSLSIEERMTLCNMVVEAGGKNGIIPADDTTIEHVRRRTDKPFSTVQSDPGARYHSIHVYQAQQIEPTVAKPHRPDQRATARELSDVTLTRAYIGSCTGGKTEDLAAAAKVLKGNSVTIETFVVPATVEVERNMRTQKIGGHTIEDIFLSAGVKIGPPSCAACLGGPTDTYGRMQGKEVCISTTNRNFHGRMGSKEGQIFLASPYTAAASAVRGKITDPRELLED